MNQLNTAIYSKLSASTALTSALGGTALYYLQAPDGAALPYVIWDTNAGREENATPNRSRDETVYIRAHALTAAAAGSIDALIDTALHGTALSVSGWTNFWTSRAAEFDGVDIDQAGRRIYFSGANYRIRIDKI